MMTQQHSFLRKGPPSPGGFAFVLLLTAIHCSPVPQGEIVQDTDLLAILRPTSPLDHEQLVKADDGKVYYTAALRDSPASRFLSDYQELLHERGVSITPGGTSAHDPNPRLTNYTVKIVQEASLQPYTIRYKVAVDVVPEGRVIGDYSHPLSLEGHRLIFRIDDTILRPWVSAVVVPDRDMVVPPFPVPVPAGLYLREVTEQFSHVFVGGRRVPMKPPRVVELHLIGRLPPERTFDFYAEQLSKSLRTTSRSEAALTMVPSGPPPSWAPRPIRILVVRLDSSLFSRDGVGVRDAERASLAMKLPVPLHQRPPGSVRNVPPDTRHYWLSVEFVEETSPR